MRVESAAVRFRRGDGQTAAEQARILRLRSTSRSPERIAVPTIAVPGEKFMIMTGYPSASLLYRFVLETNYPLKGSNKLFFRDAYQRNDDSPMDFMSPRDGEAFARWLSKKTGQDWRLPTERMLRAAKDSLGGRLVGNCSELVVAGRIFGRNYLSLSVRGETLCKNSVPPGLRLRGQTIRLITVSPKT